LIDAIERPLPRRRVTRQFDAARLEYLQFQQLPLDIDGRE